MLIFLLFFQIINVIILNIETQDGDIMTVSYKKLWKLLIDKNLKKKDLISMSGLSNYTLNKLNAGKSVTTDTLVKICEALNCGIEDIMDVVED